MSRKVKGTHILNIINYVKNKRGKLGLDRLWEGIEDKRDDVKRDYDENEWVEYDLVLDFFRTIEEIFGDDLKDVPRAREIGRHISDNLGHLEYITRAKGLQEMIEKAQAGWAQVYNFGELELAELEEDRAVIRYHGFPADKNVCNYFQGSLEKDLELLDIDGKVEHTACMIEGDDYMEFTLTW